MMMRPVTKDSVRTRALSVRMPEERPEARPQEHPHPGQRDGRAPEGPLAVDGDPQQLADQVAMDLDTRDVLLGSPRGAEGCVEVVLDALGGDADQHDAVADQLPRHFALEDRGERHPREGPCPRAIVRQELIAPGVQADVGPVVGGEGTDGRLAQPHDRLVARVGAEPDSLGRQVEEGQAKGERVERRLAIVEEEEPASDDTAGVDDDIVESDLVRALGLAGRRHAAQATFAELRHHHNGVLPREDVIELRGARSDRHVAIDVQPDRPGTEDQQRVDGAGQDPVGERPGALLLDVALRDGHDRDPGIRRRVGVRRPEHEEAIVERELGRLQRTRGAEAQHDPGHGDADEACYSPVRQGCREESFQPAHLRTPPTKTGNAPRRALSCRPDRPTR
jgi:hypothetical protein